MIPPLAVGMGIRYDDQLPQLGKQKEGCIVNSCIKWLFMHGCYVWRHNSGAWKPAGSNRPIHYGKKGSSDIIGLTRTGRWIGVEAKVKGNKQSDEQIYFQRCIEEHKGLYILAYGIEDLEARIAEICE